MANKDFIVKNSLIVGSTATISGVEIDPSGVSTNQVLKFDGTKIVPGSPDEIRNFSTTFGDGTNSSYTITHGLNTRDIVATVTDVSSGGLVLCRFEATTLNTITIHLENIISSNSKKVSILSPGSATYYKTTIGDGTTSTFEINHNLGTSSVYVSAMNADSPYENILTSVRISGGNNITVDFSSAPSANSIVVCVFSASKGNYYEQTTGTRTKYRIGDTGPAGGIIFITPTTPGNSTGKYFEAAPSGWSGSALDPNLSARGTGGTPAPTGWSIGDGKANTDAIIAAGLATTSNHAAKKAKDYTTTVDGIVYNDWFLPSYDELRRLDIQSSLISGLRFQVPSVTNAEYISSSIAYVSVTTDPSPYTLSPIGHYYGVVRIQNSDLSTKQSLNPAISSTYGRLPTSSMESYNTGSNNPGDTPSRYVRPVRSFTATLTSSNTITHNFNSDEIAVVVRSEESPYDILNVNWHKINSNSIELDYSYDDQTLKTIAVFNRLGGSPGIKNIDDFSVDAPTYADDAGNIGEVSWDENYLYICVAKDTWKRLSLSSWD